MRFWSNFGKVEIYMWAWIWSSIGKSIKIRSVLYVNPDGVWMAMSSSLFKVVNSPSNPDTAAVCSLHFWGRWWVWWCLKIFEYPTQNLSGDQIHKRVHDGEPFTTSTSERVTQIFRVALGNAKPREDLCKIIDLQTRGTPEYYKHNYTDRLVVSNGLNRFLHTRGEPMLPPHDIFKRETGFPFPTGDWINHRHVKLMFWLDHGFLLWITWLIYLVY